MGEGQATWTGKRSEGVNEVFCEDQMFMRITMGREG